MPSRAFNGAATALRSCASGPEKEPMLAVMLQGP
jgi:hypothetical protein